MGESTKKKIDDSSNESEINQNSTPEPTQNESEFKQCCELVRAT